MDDVPSPPIQGSQLQGLVPIPSSSRIPSHVLDTYLHHRPVEHKFNDDANEDSNTDFSVDNDAIRFAAKAAADLKRERYNEYKESIEEEAKKITLVYHEIQQKHDIAMKLEQARITIPLIHKYLHFFY